MYCNKCGREIEEENDFCTHCGQKASEKTIENSIQKERVSINSKSNNKLKSLKRTHIIILISVIITCTVGLIVLLSNKRKYRNIKRRACCS